MMRMIAVFGVAAFLVVALTGVATHLFTGTGTAPTSTPRALNLQLADLPSGFTLKSALTRTNAQVAVLNHERLADEIRWGRITSSDVEFDRTALVGLLYVESTVEQFHTAAQASASLARSTARGYRQHRIVPMSVAPVGVAHAGWTYTGRNGGLDGTGYVVEFCRGPYDVLVITVGLTGTFDTSQLDRLAGIVDHRIQQHI